MNVDSIRANRTRAILAFSVPAIISMVLTSLINMADGFFMGNFIHKDAIAAVNLGLPIIYLFLATGLMVSVGGSVIAGMSIGRKDEESCRSVFSQTIATCAVASVLLSVVMFFLLRTILAVLGAEGDVAEYFLQYYTILLFELPVMTVNASLGMFVRAEGRPQFYMAVTAFTCVLNILLDWLFTVGFGFGVRGIAAEWGAMLSAARTYMRDYPHMVLFPGLAIALVVLSLNMLGDGLRDALDPKLKK